MIVETGAGLPDADSYASVAESDAYFATRGNTDWAALDTAAKESALILATDYLEATYSQAWLGERTSGTQALSWPRRGVMVDGFAVPANTVPVAVKKATFEMAFRASAGEPLIIDQAQRVTKEKVDVLEITYAEFSDPALRYPYVNRLLLAYIRGSGDGSFQQARLNRV
jgi:hypothetical protein